MLPPNPCRDFVVEHLVSLGAEQHAWFGMSEAERLEGVQLALKWKPTHLCDMGGDLIVAAHAAHTPGILGAIEATASGVVRVRPISDTLPFPVWNWDEVPIKNGLHNRFMVGTTAVTAFYARTQLTFHGMEVAVAGYGMVGEGVAAAARSFGGSVTVVERDAARRMRAEYSGYRTAASIEDVLPSSDVVITATGAKKVIDVSRHFPLLKQGGFLLNVGHSSAEIVVGDDVKRETVRPFVERLSKGEKHVYLLANGAPVNIAAGSGDSINAFDLTLALLTVALAHVFSEQGTEGKGMALLPEGVWRQAL
ncbi:adenosylhomocysteinase [Kipferlia bialata]|uniref:Adenosylhomocysteinase n=1 Tax=Kipferlia bialata TaxID=797122 RepID=A0A9K3D2R8_9EUKA|nr:adenosylhomocysteinase [Kipferlia bialata]|eukprot:g8036.t1